MPSPALVELALQTQCCNQKALAAQLGVSPTQISKWKKGEHLSFDMERELRALAGIGDYDAQFVMDAGSVDNAAKWERLIWHLAETAQENEETGYDTYQLTDEPWVLCAMTFDVLREMGVAIPKDFSVELDIAAYEAGITGDDDSDRDIDWIDPFWDSLDDNPYADLIYRMYKSLTDVYGFYAAYVADICEDLELGLENTNAVNIEPALLWLAASKIDVDARLAPDHRKFKRCTTENYEEWLGIVKDKAFRAGVPLRAELLNMVYDSHDELGHEAEAESLGFNKSRLHPDVYMNEILVGMRVIHQVLPVILKKLGIYEQFKIDGSDIHLGSGRARANEDEEGGDG